MKLDVARWTAGKRLWWLTAGAVVVIGAVTWLAWPQPAPPRARQFIEYTACLLTDERGILGPEAAQVWAGLGEASAATRAQTEYTAVTGDQSVENALTYLKGLAVGHCDVLFAVGTGPVGAVQSAATDFPKVRFYTVGGGRSGGNIERVDADVRSNVSRIVTESVAAGSR